MRVYAVVLVLVVSFGGILYLFWSQELKYVLPTPVPANYIAKEVRQKIDLRLVPAYQKNIPVYLHFFNPDCPCSRFNLKHFNSLVKTFKDQVQVFAVIPAYADIERARDMIRNEEVVVIQDKSDSLAAACGVYSTPQAVIIDSDQKLFYRGNYNKSRYCTLKESNYAEIALNALVAGQEPPPFNQLATKSYGCELPENNNNNLITLFP
jgi:Domain of unknown function (DUF6436)